MVQIGVNESILSHFPSGKNDKISDDRILCIAKAFGVSTDFIWIDEVIKNENKGRHEFIVESRADLYCQRNL